MSYVECYDGCGPEPIVGWLALEILAIIAFVGARHRDWLFLAALSVVPFIAGIEGGVAILTGVFVGIRVSADRWASWSHEVTRLFLICLALAVGLSTGCRPPAPPAPPIPSPDVAIPASLRGFNMTATEPIAETDGGGNLYRFRDGSAAYITVFVYPVPPDVRAATDSARWVVIEGEKFARVLPIFVERGRYDAVEMAFANPEPVVVGNDTIPGFAAAAVTRSKKVLEVQLQYLYLVNGQFLKVRATVPQDAWQNAPIPLFARDLARALRPQH